MDRRSVMLALSTVTFAGCNHTPRSGSSDHEQIEALVRSLPKINVDNPADDPIVGRHPIGDFEGSGPGRRQVFEERRRLTTTFEEIATLNPTAGPLFPGSIIQGQTLKFGDLTAINIPRSPLTITVNGIVSSSPAADFSRTVNDPSNATITTAISSILSQNLNAEQPARIAYTKIEVHSIEQAFLQLKASYGWIAGHVQGSFQSSSDTRISRIMVRYVQSYYTVSCREQSSPASFIADSAKFEDFSQFIGRDNPPAYIRSVTFGRELWFLFESSSSNSDLQVAADASFLGGGANLNDAQRQLINQSSIQYLIIGGGGTPAIKAVNGVDKASQIAGYLSEGANFSRQSPGAAISYVACYMIDNRTARISSTADYTIRTSVANPETALTEILFSINTGDDDKDDDNHVSIRFTLLPANVLLYSDPDIRPRQPDDNDSTWHNDDRRKVNFRVPLDVFESDPKAKQVKVTISKTGGAHWHFGFDFDMKFSTGKTVPVASRGPNDRNFGDNYNSESWTATIPWGNA